MLVSGVPVVNMTVQQVMAEDLHNADIQVQVEDFNKRLNRWLDDTNFVLPGNEDIDYYLKDDYTIDNKNRDPENGDADDKARSQ